MLLLLIIFISLVLFLLYFFLQEKKNHHKLSIKILGFLSLMSFSFLLTWMKLGNPLFILKLSWFKANFQSFSLSFYMDLAFVMFSCVALYVTWSIVEFSHYYMSEDPKKQSFLHTLLLFLFFMLLLVSSNSLFLLFIGWEGVGMLSFILMGWWHTRSEANSSALQAMIYNRMGDSGMLLFLGLSMMYLNSWDLNSILYFKNIPKMALAGMILAAAGKSAQFSLHPWLPSAMEGPTPVSALLHSSTMVVAGVFLLFRCFPLLESCNWTLLVISTLGAITALFASSVALFQFDMKKMVAYSTTSQLGLMFVAMGLGLPYLALFHICTHAFFKALLFLCSGSLMHSLANEQDLRKLQGSGKFLPFTMSCLMVASLALCGIPFLAGFYSKDIMLEMSQNNMINSICTGLSLLATLFTAIYSFRMIYFLTSLPSKSNPLMPLHEEKFKLIAPLLRLTLGIMLSGWIFSISILDFKPIFLPWLNKGLPLMLTFYSAALMFGTLIHLKSKTPKIPPFLGMKWFFVQIFHPLNSQLTSLFSLKGVLRSLDQGWTAWMGPKGMMSLILPLTSFIQKSQTGLIHQYIFYSMIFVSSLLLFQI